MLPSRVLIYYKLLFLSASPYFKLVCLYGEAAINYKFKL